MILFRYFSREVFSAVISVTLILIFVFLANQTVRLLSQAASGSLATGTVLKLIGLELPFLLGILLPLGLFLGVLVSYSRFYADNEMTVLRASGMGKWQLLKTTLIISSVIFVAVSLLMFGLNPLLSAQKEKILKSSAAGNLVATLVPGSFKATNSGRDVFFVGGVSTDHKSATDIFIAQYGENSSVKKFKQGDSWTVLVANEGEEYIDDTTKDKFVVAKSGYRYQGVAGQQDFQVSKFDEYGVLLPQDDVVSENVTYDALPTLALLKNTENNIRYETELQWRIALPISALLLAVLAMQLSHVSPRKGRFQNIIPAILIYVVYANLIFIARDWMNDGTTPALIGLWWVHGLLLLLIGIIAFRQVRQGK